MPQQGCGGASGRHRIETVSLPEELASLVVNEDDAHMVTVLSVTGPDAQRFLDGQLSQELGGLTDGQGRWSLVLEPDGHLGGLLQVLKCTDEHFVLLGAQEGSVGMAPDALLERLKRFKIRVKVELALTTACRVVGPGALSLPERIKGIPVHLVLGEEVLDGPGDTVGRRAVFEGRVTQDTAPVGLTPAGLGAAVIEESVSFTKGCYTGQELVARMDSRGATPPRRLARIAGATGGLPGAPGIEGAEGIELVEVVVDRASGRLGGIISVPRSLGDLAALSVRFGDVPVVLAEVVTGTDR